MNFFIIIILSRVMVPPFYGDSIYYHHKFRPWSWNVFAHCKILMLWILLLSENTYIVNSGFLTSFPRLLFSFVTQIHCVLQITLLLCTNNYSISVFVSATATCTCFYLRVGQLECLTYNKLRSVCLVIDGSLSSG